MITKFNKLASGTEFVAKFIAPDGTICTPPSSIAPFSSVAYLFVGLVVDLSASGELIGLRYGDAEYFYDRNVLGDILDILDASGHAVVSYSYDPWGKPEMSNDGTTAGQDLMSLNPFLYRGYVYDQESGFYYLMSRYYDPDLCRFLSADDVLPEPGDFSALNPYAYCYNDPINYSDPIGRFAISSLLIVLGFVAAFAAIDAAIGAIAYEINAIRADEQDAISINKGGISIENGFLLPGFFSKLVFLYLARSDEKYLKKGLSTERSLIGQTTEWWGHNVLSYVAIVGSALLSVLPNTDLEVVVWRLFYDHTKDVDLENRWDWWKFWEHF